jgi:2Fe-2S ferredoxin
MRGREQEEDQLGKAWGLETFSRLSCQVRVSESDLVVEIPRYTLNVVSEHR